MNEVIYEFAQNKYYKWYFVITNRAKLQMKTNDYVEKHHIIPKSLGGNNSKENLVLLTAKEHYICHRLLVKFCIGKSKSKMVYALHRMCNHGKTSRVYDIARKLYSEQLKKDWTKERKISHGVLISKKQIGKKHSDYTKNLIRQKAIGRKYSEDTKKKLSIMRKGKQVPWVKEWTFISPEGISFTFMNLTKFCTENNLDQSAMWHVSKGKYTQHKGWKFMAVPKGC